MEKIYIVMTEYFDKVDKLVHTVPIISYVSKSEAERFMKKRDEDDKNDIQNLQSQGVYAKRWYIQELSVGDLNLTGTDGERESYWIKKRADNDWDDYICANCSYTENIHPDLKHENRAYCPKCGYRMTNGK